MTIIKRTQGGYGMSGYCRICHDQGNNDVDSLVACNNCGSLACARHHTWWRDSKNAFCTVCFPLSLVAALNRGADGLAAMKDENMAAEHLRRYVEGVLNERDL